MLGTGPWTSNNTEAELGQSSSPGSLNANEQKASSSHMDEDRTKHFTSWASPGAGITGGYDGDSDTFRIFIVFFAGLAIYNACELVVMVFLTFRTFRGLYFWSMLVAALGIVPYDLGFLLKFMNITTGDAIWSAIVLCTVGWYLMVTGQAVVLWSRLHLIVCGKRGDRILRWTKCMIVMNILILHLPTTVLTFGSTGRLQNRRFTIGYNIMEKIQMAGFFLQEVTLSSVYILETMKILQTSLRPGTRKTMRQLVVINVVIILMDLCLLALESASLYILETLLKGVVYSIKLKLEFAILGKLVNFVDNAQRSEDFQTTSVGFITTNDCESREDSQMQVVEFVDLSKISADIAYASPSCKMSHPLAPFPTARVDQKPSFELDLARFEHVEHVEHIDSLNE